MMQLIAENNKTSWLGEFPEHWQVLRIKNVFQEVEERSETGKEELLSVSHYTGVTLKKDSLESEDEHLTNAASLVGYKKVQKGDLVSNIMLAWNGSMGISTCDGITSPAYGVYRIKGDNNPEYFGFLFTTELFKVEFRRNSTGIIDSRLRLYSDEFFRIFTTIPPRIEQNEIVNFIKFQQEKINRFVKRKLQFINLLKEQRQSIINNYIFNGIGVDVKKQQTKYNWMGEVPKHWKICRVKNCGKVVLGKMLCSDDKGDYFLKPYLKSKNIGWEKVIVDEVDEMWFSASELETYRIRHNDLLVSEGGEVGKTCIWNNELDECYIQNSVHKITFFKDCLPEYYLFYFGVLGALGYFKSIVNQVSIAHLTREKLVAVACLRPPYDEQKQIVEKIKVETKTIDIAISKAEREIELIEEYKKVMIAQAVMGKI